MASGTCIFVVHLKINIALIFAWLSSDPPPHLITFFVLLDIAILTSCSVTSECGGVHSRVSVCWPGI